MFSFKLMDIDIFSVSPLLKHSIDPSRRQNFNVGAHASYIAVFGTEESGANKVGDFGGEIEDVGSSHLNGFVGERIL